jgi:hypothetical protein
MEKNGAGPDARLIDSTMLGEEWQDVTRMILGAAWCSLRSVIFGPFWRILSKDVVQ